MKEADIYNKIRKNGLYNGMSDGEIDRQIEKIMESKTVIFKELKKYSAKEALTIINNMYIDIAMACKMPVDDLADGLAEVAENMRSNSDLRKVFGELVI